MASGARYSGSSPALGPTEGDPDGSDRTGSSTPPAAAGVEAARVRWTLLALSLSLLGMVALAALVFGVRLHGVRDSLGGLPTRDLYVIVLGLIAAPLFLALTHRISPIFVIVPIATLVLIYALFNPFGIPYSRDPVYNFQFANVLLQTGRWTPGAVVTQQAVAYSFYPGSAVYNAEFSVFTGLPLPQTFLVASPLLHLLVLPPAVYTIGAQMFGSRAGYGGVLFYLATPSILFNVPVQQEFALPFFTLTLLALCLLSANPPSPTALGLRVGVVLFSSYVVISHHLSSYFLAAWLAGLFFVPYMLGGARERRVIRLGQVRGREVLLLTERTGPVEGPLRPGPMLGRYLLVFVLFSFVVSAPVLYHHIVVLNQALAGIVQGIPPSARTASVGQSFPLYQQVWIYATLGILLVVALLAARRFLRSRRHSFLVTNLIIAAIAILATLPFLPTTLGFLPLREMEFSAPFVAPALTWWLLARFRPWLRRWLAQHRSTSRPWLRRLGPTAGVLLLAGLVFTGGSLVPVDVRDQFAPPSSVLVDSPLYLDPAGYGLGIWAHGHLNGSVHLWGDYLAYSVFGGFGEFKMRYYQYELFNGSNISTTAWHALGIGDYVVTDRYMTQLTPEFPGPPTGQPTGPLTTAQVQKFDLPPYFDRVYQDPTFTIYELLQKPPGL
jgi:hypothetical protein